MEGSIHADEESVVGYFLGTGDGRWEMECWIIRSWDSRVVLG